MIFLLKQELFDTSCFTATVSHQLFHSNCFIPTVSFTETVSVQLLLCLQGPLILFFCTVPHLVSSVFGPSVGFWPCVCVCVCAAG